MTKLTTHSRSQIDQQLNKARQDLATAIAKANSSGREIAERRLSGSKADQLFELQQEPARIRSVIAGLEQISAEREYFDTRKAIERGIDAIEVSHRTGISDRYLAFREMYARKDALEHRFPDFAARYELSK